MKYLQTIICYIERMISSQVFSTVLSGMVLFILSNYFLELYIKPRLKLQNEYSKISIVLLKYQRKIYNSSLLDDERDEIRITSVGLLSCAWNVYRRKSKRIKFLDISKKLNYIIAQNDPQKTDFVLVEQYLHDIEVLNSNIITTYSNK